jgi:hypothetical protein
VFDGPQAFDRSASKKIDTPENWREELPGQGQVSVVPFTDGAAGPDRDIGWCTAGPDIKGPETEVFCGGINSKQTTHAGAWRQGNLLHFGFEPSPRHLNQNGRALLLNCIAYIANFKDDRPIAQFVSPFSEGPRRQLRGVLRYYINADDTKADELAKPFASPLREQIAAMPVAEGKKYVQANWNWLRCRDGDGFVVDADAKALQVGMDDTALLTALVRDLAVPDRAARAQTSLARLVPAGPAAGDAAAWAKWLGANQRYLFYSEAGGYHWLLDALAQQRSVPSAELRGPARATAKAAAAR